MIARMQVRGDWLLEQIGVSETNEVFDVFRGRFDDAVFGNLEYCPAGRGDVVFDCLEVGRFFGCLTVAEDGRGGRFG